MVELSWAGWLYGVAAAVMALEAWYIVAVRRQAYPWLFALSNFAVAAGYRVTSAASLLAVSGILFGIERAVPWTFAMDQWWHWALLCVGVDFVYYWLHRHSHECRWFWASHSVHHSAEHINLPMAFRLGWTGLISGMWVYWALLIVAGFPVMETFGMISLNLLFQFWLHTETVPRLDKVVPGLGSLMEYVFNTPSNHRVHHGRNPEYLDRNYGGILIIWDRMFGTFVREEDAIAADYGTITPVTTLNPIRIVLAEWTAWWRDMRQARSARDVFWYSFGPPGWKPDGTGMTTRRIRAMAGAANTSPPGIAKAAPPPVAAE